MTTTVIEAPQVHIYWEGRSIDVLQSDLDIGPASTDDQVRAAMAGHLGLPPIKLQIFSVDRTGPEITIRPPATFG